jgi:DNA-binding GntR family transcriptional regulator
VGFVILETRSVVDALRAEIQSQIVGGSIPPGTTLPEVSVAQMFDVARPTAKAAIEQLVHIGMLRRLRNKTARVPLFNAADIADLYLSRGVIESAVTRLLAERGEVPSGAAAALDRFRAAIDNDGKIAELVQSDIDFHRALVDATGSSRLRRLHESIIGEAHLCMSQVQVHHLLHPGVIADEHARILAMIEAGDVDQATSEMTAHISQAGDRLVAYLQRSEANVASDPSVGSPL